MKWYVRYTVEGFGLTTVGPWELREALYQRDDISGFEGVSDVHLLNEDELAKETK